MFLAYKVDLDSIFSYTSIFLRQYKIETCRSWEPEVKYNPIFIPDILLPQDLSAVLLNFD